MTTVMEGADCVVCLSRYDQGDYLAVLPCGHMYHRDCVIPYLWGALPHAQCPVCRASFTKEQLCSLRFTQFSASIFAAASTQSARRVGEEGRRGHLDLAFLLNPAHEGDAVERYHVYAVVAGDGYAVCEDGGTMRRGVMYATSLGGAT